MRDKNQFSIPFWLNLTLLIDDIGWITRWVFDEVKSTQKIDRSFS